jgi:methylphosphotriester-DNA--protein-cysteine methyltransferase
MPFLSIKNLLDGEVILPLATKTSFWLHGSSWQLPDFDNVETFVEKLVRNGTLLADPIVHSALQNQPQGISERTIRRRFLQATGLTPKTLEQIERAQHATALLQQGLAPLDVAYQAGYADQPHMTRSLKHFIGYTPTQIAQMPPLE